MGNFINTYSNPVTPIEKYFATKQEAARKDIERAFGTLVQQFQILQRPIRSWDWKEIVDLVDCCVILHNMIVEHRRGGFAVGLGINETFYAATDEYSGKEPIKVSMFKHDYIDEDDDFETGFKVGELLSMRVAALNEDMKNTTEHLSLKYDLMNHMWDRRHQP
jgi:Plant transposon protein